MKKPIIYQPRASVLRGVQKQHTSRVLHDLDASSTLSFVRDGDKSTAHWTHNGTSHHIQVNEEMVCFIQHPDMLAKSRHRRKELQYLRAVHNHEVAHALYTSRDFKDINDRCKTEKVPFRDMNLFEDARIESLFRQRRPFAVGRKNDLDHEGNYSCEPYTYGVRKFEWLKWDVFNLENPRNAFLSFIKCEGTKKHLDSLETYWSSQLGLGGGFKSPNPKHTGTYTFDWFLKLWRKVAGRGADSRYPTTGSLFPLVKMFNEIFPCPPGEADAPINGIGGSDFVESAKKAGEKIETGSGGKEEEETPTPPPPPPEKPKMKVTDKKRGGKDESDKQMTESDHNALGLDPNYFTWDS